MPERNPNEAKVVRFTNIFDFDYTHAYGGVPYQLRAGVTQLFPWAIGDHLATHLARQALIRKAPTRDDNATDGRSGESTRSDRPLWDDTAISALKSKIIQDAYVEERTAPLSEAEQYKKKVDELNKQFPGLVPAESVESPTVSSVPGSITAGVTPTVPMPETQTNQPVQYLDKGEVIAALKAKGIAHDARLSRASLEKLLK